MKIWPPCAKLGRPHDAHNTVVFIMHPSCSIPCSSSISPTAHRLKTKVYSVQKLT